MTRTSPHFRAFLLGALLSASGARADEAADLLQFLARPATGSGSYVDHSADLRGGVAYSHAGRTVGDTVHVRKHFTPADREAETYEWIYRPAGAGRYRARRADMSADVVITRDGPRLRISYKDRLKARQGPDCPAELARTDETYEFVGPQRVRYRAELYCKTLVFNDYQLVGEAEILLVAKP